MGQKILDRQPNWLIPPARWRTQPSNQHPVRYRTPTPYPKDDRKPMPEPAQVTTIKAPEKAFVLGTAAASHVEVINPQRKRTLMHPRKPLVQAPPQPALKITWEVSPRLNRFERAA
jgi:hypothetical protein